jgi:hypothetical protein
MQLDLQASVGKTGRYGERGIGAEYPKQARPWHIQRGVFGSMSGSNRHEEFGPWFVKTGLLAVAIVIAWTVYSVVTTSSQNRQYADQNTAQIRSEAEEYVSHRCPGLDGIIKKNCLADAEKTAHNQEQAEADLYAQRQMAVWAFAVGVSGLISVPVSLAGIFFVWRSLRLTRNALDAALSANTIAQVQNRPWIDLTIKPNGQIHFSSDSRMVSVPLSITFHNKGKMPATSVSFEYSYLINWTHFDIKEELKHIDAQQTGEGLRRSIIFPNESKPEKTTYVYNARTFDLTGQNCVLATFKIAYEMPGSERRFWMAETWMLTLKRKYKNGYGFSAKRMRHERIDC